ncbi:MAG: phosphodiesterase [Atopobiaceae bacterium]|nr:phosphodiesterase [Atopobiaceae bacterium]
MRVVPPRQVAVLSIANYDSICSTYGSHAGEQAIASLREFAIRNGVDPGYMRRFGNNTLLLRLDDLPRDKFLSVICSMADQVQDYVVPDYKDARPVVRVGAMSERALRSFVNDAASDLLAYMNHVDCRAAFLAGDELDIWQKLNTTGVELLSHEQLKHIDPFTGLLTIDRFFSLLQEIVEAQESFNTDITVLYLDIDDFKSFNRAFDHDAGDELLLFVANKIAKAFPTDIVAHLTVDRFAVVSDSSDVVRKCAALHEQTRSFREAFAPELKCGAFVLEKEVRSAHIALDCAKLACESIKGRFDVAYRSFDGDLKERFFTRRYVARHAEEAVHDNWIRAFAQPVVCTSTGKLCGFEALARWDDPERGILSPAIFIPTLEDAHLIHKLDACMVDEVCHYLSECQQQGEEVVPASINLSRLDFQLCDALEMVISSCKRWNIPYDLLAIEVTESALNDRSDLRAEMDRFRAAGFEVWMDDFGCGYSSLNLLKDYEFDVLKVDMEFLRDLEVNERSKTIVASVISMAKRLGIRTLVEGVETTAHHEFLRSLGCDMMQGYLFGKPRPLAIGAL